jgi:hypothetical protein
MEAGSGGILLACGALELTALSPNQPLGFRADWRPNRRITPMTTTMMASRFATEDTDIRVTTYNGAKITTYRNIKQAMHDRRKNELPSGDA